MPARFNPYSEWLQVHSSSARPTHYELLNVSSDESLVENFVDAAKAQIEKLKAADPGSRVKLRDRVAREIRHSLKVLSDSAARKEYDKMLLNRNLKPADIEPPSRKNSKKNLKQADLDPPSRGDSKKRATKHAEKPVQKTVPKPVQKSVPIAKPVSATVPTPPPAVDADPPMARPVASPKTKSGSQPANDAEPPSKSRPKTSPTAKPAKLAKSVEPTEPTKPPVPAAAKHDSQKTDTAPPTNRAPKRLSELRPRKKNTAGLVIGILGLVIVVSLLGYIANLYRTGELNETFNKVAANFKPSPPEEPATPDSLTTPESKTANEPANETANKTVEVTVDPTLPQSAPFPVFEEKELAEPQPKATEPERESDPTDNPKQAEEMNTPKPGTDPPGNSLSNTTGSGTTDSPITEPPAVTVDPIVDAPVEEPAKTPNNPEQVQEKQVSFDELKALPLAEQYELKNQLLVIKNLWHQQLFDDVPEVVAEVRQGPHGDQLGDAILATNEKLRGFWEHFALSCQQFPDRQIVIDDRVVGLVEALPNSVILRISGTNREYEHRFVPPGLMMAIADRVVEPEDTEYELKKAAFYISQLSAKPKYSARVDETLTEYETAQIDVSELRLMTNLKFWELGETVDESDKVKFRPDRELSDGLKEAFAAESAKKTKPPEAFDLMQSILKAAATPSDGSHFGMEDTLDPQEMRKRRMVMLEAARAYGVRSGYTPLVVDIVNELSAISTADKDEVLFDSLIELSRTAGLDTEYAKLFCDEVLQVSRGTSAYSRKELGRLCQSAIKVAEKQNLRTFGLQLVNKLNSLSN